MLATEGRAGIVVGPPHSGGGVNFHDPATGNYLQEEGFEINIPEELTKDKRIHLFRGTNAEVIDQILRLAGHSLANQVTKVNPGDIIICVRSAWDTAIRTYVGTVEKILDDISLSNGCNSIRRQVAVAHNGGKAPKGIKQRVKDWQSENPNSPRWKKKKKRIHELSNNIHRFRVNISRDLNSDDERDFLTALVASVMDRTAERIGNDDSADNGHFGVTGFRKRHINVKGDTISLHYIGKSGTEHHKTFTDEKIASALKKAIRNSPSSFIFETSDGFRIKSDRVNRYLKQFNISSKDIRGYNANRWIIDILKKEEPKRKITGDDRKDKKARKSIFNKAVKETALRVGHGQATLKKHYMIPELQSEYIADGHIIDTKNMGYYSEGGRMGDVSISDHFPNKNQTPDIVNKAIEDIENKYKDREKGAYELFSELPVEVITWENVIPGQDFLRSSKTQRLEAVEDIYSIGLPWVIEYDGKFYVLDGHHRILEMHNKNMDIKAHVYHVTSMARGGAVPDRYKRLGFNQVGQKKQSTRPDKKWMVLARKGNSYKIVHGGQKGMQDFTQHHNEERRKRFWNRMGGFDSDKTKDPFSPLYWHKRFGTWEDGGKVYDEEVGHNLYDKGTIKTAWINESDPDILESHMYDDVESALKDSEGKQFLIFELDHTDNDYYRWKLLPYGMYDKYKLAHMLTMENGGKIKQNNMKNNIKKLSDDPKFNSDVKGIKHYARWEDTDLYSVSDRHYLITEGNTYSLTDDELNSLLQELEEYNNPLSARNFLAEKAKEGIYTKISKEDGGIASEDIPSFKRGYFVKEIGGKFWVVYEFGDGESMPMSKPYNTPVAAEKAMVKIKDQAGVKENGGTAGSESQIANEILSQLGGNKFLAMMGAAAFRDGNSLILKIKGSKNVKSINISLNKKDLYDIDFINWRKSDFSDITTKTFNDVYADNITNIIEKETGLYTKLEDGGPVADAVDGPGPACICFSTFLKENKPELVEKLMDQDVNESPELRSEMDEAYQAYNGGKIKQKAPITNERLLEILNEEIKKNGIGVWTERRKIAEEMLRMRGVKF